MLTCWSDSARVTSDSSRERSRASTWIVDQEHARRLGRPAHRRPAGPAPGAERAHVHAVVRCTETPLPRVTKPMIASPGTGCSTGELDPDVVVTVDHDAGIALRAPALPVRAAGRGRRPRRGPRSRPRRRRGTARAAARRSSPTTALADGGVERGDVRVAQCRRTARQRCRRTAAAAAAGSDLRIALASEVLAAARSPPRGAPWRTTP